jgi:hypothetical protein
MRAVGEVVRELVGLAACAHLPDLPPSGQQGLSVVTGQKATFIVSIVLSAVDAPCF